MNKGWEIQRLGHLCRIKTGKKDVNEGNPDGAYPFFTCAASHTFSDSYSFDTEALLVAGNGDVGKVSYYHGKFEAYQRTYVLSDFSGVLPRYLYLILDGKLRDTVSKQKLGNTMPYIKMGMLTEFPVPIPPLPEQQRIVGILDEAFDGIATAKANAEKNLQNARALFESHLQSVFTNRGDGWGRMVPLSSILSVQPRNGWSPPAQYQTGTGIPVLTLSSVTGFEYDGSRVKLSSAPTRDDAHYWLRKGELLITRSNTRELVGHVAIYDGTPSRAICCDLIMKMQVDPTTADTRFIYYFLRSAEARSYFTTIAHGASSTMKKIGKSVVQRILVPLPTLERQKSTVTMLDTLASKTQRLESIYQQKLAALEELKKSLLHQAFSGQL
jgi:type I restriction enzyme S subunit